MVDCSQTGVNKRKYEKHYTFVKDYSASEIEKVLCEWVHNYVYRQILHARLVDHLTFERIAEEFNYSTETIKAVVYENESVIKRELMKLK